MARGVEDVDFIVAIVETHNRSGNRDAALLFNLHPVGCCGLFDFVRLDGTGNMDSATEQEEFFGEGGFTCIGVGDDGEGATAFYFFCEGRHLYNWEFGIGN